MTLSREAARLRSFTLSEASDPRLCPASGEGDSNAQSGDLERRPSRLPRLNPREPHCDSPSLSVPHMSQACFWWGPLCLPPHEHRTPVLGEASFMFVRE